MVTASVGLVLLAVVVSLSSVVAVPPAVVTASVGVVLLAVDISVGSVVGVTSVELVGLFAVVSVAAVDEEAGDMVGEDDVECGVLVLLAVGLSSWQRLFRIHDGHISGETHRFPVFDTVS